MFYGEFKTPPNPFLFCGICKVKFFHIFCHVIEKPNFEDAHSASKYAICHHG
ncbi:hypothetical protein AB205_0095400, partial [Aquarana catesbeiana]